MKRITSGMSSAPIGRRRSTVDPPCRISRVSRTDTGNPPGWETRQLGSRRDHCCPLAELRSAGFSVDLQDRQKDGLFMKRYVRILRRILHMSWSQSQRLQRYEYGG